MYAAPWKQKLDSFEPKEGCQIQVIGAGMIRTGTNSFCAAVSHLLEGPSYHVGVQTVASGNPQATRTWVSFLTQRPYATPEARSQAHAMLARELDGFVMVTDPPAPQLLPDLLEMYPKAIVIVTLRDKKSWVVSTLDTIKLININVLELIFFWIQGLREVPTLWRLFDGVHRERYGASMNPNLESIERIWDLHMDWVHNNIPKEKLFFFDVREGWEPLCKILDKPVPKDVPFPRLNDSKAMEAAFKSWTMQGLLLWLVAMGVVVTAAAVLVQVLR